MPFHKNKMGLIIRSISTISKFYQHLCFNSRIDFNGLKYLYSVISVIDKRLSGNTKKWTLVRSWTATVRLGSVLAEFLSRFPSQIWVSDVTFVAFFNDHQCHALHLSHFWEECDALAHENMFFNLWRFLSYPFPKTSHFGPAGTKLF